MYGKIAVSLVSLLLLVGVVVGVVVIMKNGNDTKDWKSPNPSMKMVTTICESTTFKDTCARSLEPVAKNLSSTAKDYVLIVIEATLIEVNKSLDTTNKIYVDKENDQYNYYAIEDCKQLLDNAINTLKSVKNVVEGGNMDTVQEKRHEILSWMTAVYALETYCIDQIENPEHKTAIDKGMQNATQLAHNAVSIFADLSPLLHLFNLANITTSTTNPTVKPNARRLMAADGYPTWFGAGERRLLVNGHEGNGHNGRKPDLVVSKDGSGQYRTIREAVAAYPSNHTGRFTIHVRAGVYDEQVVIDQKKPNIFMYGDGMGKTIVTGKRNYKNMRITTMSTATFAVAGDGFIAQGMTFRNEAGSEGQQAVAFRSQADKTAVFACSFEGHHDTLFYQAKRQFYRNCHIYGTIDIIFGMGEAVIQDSDIIVRKPLPQQVNTITADGTKNPSGSSGLVLQNCRIVPDKFLFPKRFEIQTYLGRPWYANALTVVMQSELGDFIRPEGWLMWKGEEHHKTCHVFEYSNRGPGSRTEKRSKDFTNFKVLASPQEAERYTASKFIDGNTWLPQTNIPHRLGL